MVDKERRFFISDAVPIVYARDGETAVSVVSHGGWDQLWLGEVADPEPLRDWLLAEARPVRTIYVYGSTWGGLDGQYRVFDDSNVFLYAP